MNAAVPAPAIGKAMALVQAEAMQRAPVGLCREWPGLRCPAHPWPTQTGAVMAACVIGIIRAKAAPLVPSTRARMARKRAMVPNTDHGYGPYSNLARARRGIVIAIGDAVAPHRHVASAAVFDEGLLDDVMAWVGEAAFGEGAPVGHRDGPISTCPRMPDYHGARLSARLPDYGRSNSGKSRPIVKAYSQGLVKARARTAL